MVTDEEKKELYEMLRLKQKLNLPEEPEIPRSIQRSLSPTVRNYFESDTGHQRLARMTIRLRGKTDKYVYQISNGSQQIKLYEPEKYKNNVNTPLRVRTRMIMYLAYQTPCPDVKKKIQELHLSYPYYLLKDQPVNLRLRNFHCQKLIRDNDVLDIYRKVTDDEPDPGSDLLIDSIVFKPRNSRRFTYEGQEEQYFYAVNTRNGDISNVLRFIWQDELQEIPQRESASSTE